MLPTAKCCTGIQGATNSARRIAKKSSGREKFFCRVLLHKQELQRGAEGERLTRPGEREAQRQEGVWQSLWLRLRSARVLAKVVRTLNWKGP